MGRRKNSVQEREASWGRGLGARARQLHVAVVACWPTGVEMSLPAAHEVTQLLKAWNCRGEEALDKITSQTDRPVNEACLRPGGRRPSELAGPGALFCRLGVVGEANSD